MNSINVTHALIQKIMDPSLKMVAYHATDMLSETFNNRTIAGLSGKTTGMYGYQLLEELCKQVDKLRKRLGPTALDWDRMYFYSIVIPEGLGLRLRNCFTKGYRYNKKGDVYVSSQVVLWRSDWSEKIIESFHHARIMQWEKLMKTQKLIMATGDKVSYPNIYTWDSTMVAWLTLYHLTVR